MDKHWLKMSKKLETKVPSFSIHKYAEKGEKKPATSFPGPPRTRPRYGIPGNEVEATAVSMHIKTKLNGTIINYFFLS